MGYIMKKCTADEIAQKMAELLDKEAFMGIDLEQFKKMVDEAVEKKDKEALDGLKTKVNRVYMAPDQAAAYLREAYTKI